MNSTYEDCLPWVLNIINDIVGCKFTFNNLNLLFDEQLLHLEEKKDKDTHWIQMSRRVN